MIPAEKQKEFDELTFAALHFKSKAWVDLANFIEDLKVPMPAIHADLNYATNYVYKLFRLPNEWSVFEERLLNYLKKLIWQETNFQDDDNYHCPSKFVRYIFQLNETHLSEATDASWIEVFRSKGISDQDIWFGLHDVPNIETLPNVLIDYILNNVDKYLPILPYNFGDSYYFSEFLTKKKPEIVDKFISKFTTKVVDRETYLSMPRYHSIIIAHLKRRSDKYEPYLLYLLSLQPRTDDYKAGFSLIFFMLTTYPNKYRTEILICLEKHIDLLNGREHEIYRLDFETFLMLLLACYSTEKAFEKSSNYLCKFSKPNSLSIMFWLKNLKTNEVTMTPNIVENLWLFARHADKSVRQLTAQHIAKTLGETAIPEAETMLSDKKAEVRLTGALILSLIKTEKATAILRGCIADEMNDEVRNAMLEGVSTYLVENATIESIAESVAAAQKRGKLAKPITPWLVNYPQLTYKNGENHVDSATIAFLFYRMSQAKDIRTDIEARPLLSLIDRETSAPFAKWLLDSYFQNSANPALKWCLTLGAMLGGDNEIAFLQRNIVSFVDNNRGKMAEYVVKALALQGSQRALRAVDFFSRKYKNKSIGKAALEAFDVAAEELGMTPYELADSVIPDFGFDGLFKEFDANKETYRAYISNDFKLAFLDEDNKNLKALPKGTSAALKDEFKEIGKEIRDIVKSQSSRLEQYLVIQRRWTTDKWEGLFLTNPVMFIYAVRLIWGVFDEKNTLISVFRCQEDQSLTDKNGDEIDFENLKNAVYTEGSLLELKTSLRGTKQTNSELKDERLLPITNNSITNNQLQIGMVHPIDLDAETIDFWKNDLLDNGIEPIFPQLNRRVIALEIIDQNVKMSDAFDGVEIGGYTFLSRMDKAGWVKGSIGDGGGILSYYKEFTEVGLVAIVMQTGSLSVGYYDVNAEIGNLMFVKKEGVRFGSYMYDEPSKMKDPRLVAFGDVPPIVYSEVMADMAFFKENQVK
jgi:hypothetical protein